MPALCLLFIPNCPKSIDLDHFSWDQNNNGSSGNRVDESNGKCGLKRHG
jgi:hypothetical protein